MEDHENEDQVDNHENGDESTVTRAIAELTRRAETAEQEVESLRRKNAELDDALSGILDGINRQTERANATFWGGLRHIKSKED